MKVFNIKLFLLLKHNFLNRFLSLSPCSFVECTENVFKFLHFYRIKGYEFNQIILI